jgi:hypothetical protein
VWGQALSLENKTLGVALVELGWRSMWPLLCLLGIVLFHPQVEDLLRALSSRTATANSIRIGSVEITAPEQTISPPPKEVAELLPQLDPDMINYILMTDPKGGGSETTCWLGSDYDEELGVDGYLRKLALIKLISIKVSVGGTNENGEHCQRKAEVSFATLFFETRPFYKRLIKNLKFGQSK